MMSSSAATATADACVEEGTALHGQGRLAEAERRYRDALARDPEHGRALCFLGLATAQQGRLEDGLALLQRAVARVPDMPEAHNHLGAVLQELGRHQEALERYQRALVLAPHYPDARLNLATVQQALGWHGAAVEGLSALVRDHPDHAVAHFNLGIALHGAGRTADARAARARAVALAPALAARVPPELGGGTAAAAPPAGAEAAAQRRMNEYLSSFLTNQNNPRMSMYPGLTERAVHDPARFPIVQALEAAFPAIRREIEALAASTFHAESEGLEGTEGWDVLLLYERGRKNAENCARCPTITRIIESHATVRTLAGLMYVSKTNPGTHIKPHLGPTNVRLRCHLGIKVPAGDCGLKVGGQPLRWQEGRCIVFDDHLEHESWNFTSEPRIVLIIDVWHPDLTPTEIAFLEGLHRFAAYQAVSLNRYWTRNAEARAKARALYD
jgi:aspartyl/asparaginyl beta-hydroxylase (cupin superfamily)/Flp pilus assembly protein TadD